MNKEKLIDLFTKILKENNKSVTKSRMLIFEILANNNAQSINGLVKKTKGKIDRSSLYRVIEAFEELGLIEKVPIGWKYKIELSDIFNSHHHHITCRRCDNVSVAEANHELEKIIDDIAKNANYSFQRHQVEISGICLDCQTE